MAAQQGLPQTAVAVNLKAIQNLNSYIDGVVALEQGGPYSFSSAVIDIEFVMAFSSHSKGTMTATTMSTIPTTNTTNTTTTTTASTNAAQPTTSRRRVELQVPQIQMSPHQVTTHVYRQVIKLLRMADLSIPKGVNLGTLENAYNDDDMNQSPTSSSDLNEEWIVDQVFQNERRQRPMMTRWDRSRDRFLRRINWTKFDQVYERALRDAQANLETRGLIRNNRRLRNQLLAKILSHVTFLETVQPLERLVAYRRLLRVLDEHFDHLQLESFGRYWENVQISVTESRPYNTSSSALRKRRQRHLETGYRFTIHHDNSVTVQIPVDFQNDELIQELYRNVRDFYEWTQPDYLGLEGILEEEEGLM